VFSIKEWKSCSPPSQFLCAKHTANFVKMGMDALRSFVLLKYKFLYLQLVMLWDILLIILKCVIRVIIHSIWCRTSKHKRETTCLLEFLIDWVIFAAVRIVICHFILWNPVVCLLTFPKHIPKGYVCIPFKNLAVLIVHSI